ncbi:MAG: hypothetical protein JOZ99_07975 [Actinobacteria bacterium]|nr:hypothetical protein [Actinomycetota bacterium]
MFVDDAEPAQWLSDRIEGFAASVGSIVASGFEKYARIFHPAARFRADVPIERRWTVRPQAVRWSEVAAANGTTLHREAQFENLSGVYPNAGVSQPGVWDLPPQEGELPAIVAHRLSSLLERHTHTPSRCWFCVWEGWGGLRTPAGIAPLVNLPHRRYFLATAPIAAVHGSFEAIHAQGPSIWWPDDRAWCVATEIDSRSTYVGGSGDGIDEILDDDVLEALPARIDDGVGLKSDHVNPLPANG